MLDPKGKRKASEEAHGQSSAKKSARAQDFLDMEFIKEKEMMLSSTWPESGVHALYVPCEIS